MNSSPSTPHIPTPRLSGLILNSASPPSRRRPSQRPGFVLLIAPNGECLCLQLLVLSASLHCLPGTREVYGGYCGPLMNAVALPARLLSLLPGSLFDLRLPPWTAVPDSKSLFTPYRFCRLRCMDIPFRVSLGILHLHLAILTPLFFTPSPPLCAPLLPRQACISVSPRAPGESPILLIRNPAFPPVTLGTNPCAPDPAFRCLLPSHLSKPPLCYSALWSWLMLGPHADSISDGCCGFDGIY